MIIRFRYCFVNFPHFCKIKLSNLVKKELLVCVHELPEMANRETFIVGIQNFFKDSH